MSVALVRPYTTIYTFKTDMYTFFPSHSNLSQNQQKRGLQQVGSLPLSASPQQLSLTAGLLPPSSYATHPYHTSPYTTSTSPFGYHPPPHLQHHQQHSPFQQQPLAPPPQPQQIPQSPLNPRKRRASELDPHSLGGSSLGGYGLDQHGIFGNPDRHNSDQNNYVLSGPSTGGTGPGDQGIPRHDTPPARPKKGRTNTPWTPAEEQRLKVMRDAGNSWSEIAKTFPTRTEGSVKKHWYKDMHYAEFAEDESAALLAAIKEYEQSKWKVIGQKVGKPAKACEQYAKEHFGTKS
ncbi:hypothetical protein E4T50_10176 [Aureobasidium sp. EXF-12298]|nr:hypothetical protein E4T50_10176 [Aureobasidium sp. EXF-12298]KAI4757157.1 hypothetical protein E4T51_09782 [Aureobasidium sp. EXF-12344]KAI4774740.1 hypothetical protein E4T52_10285 [Aureobasidium sp. EXF-3400]